MIVVQADSANNHLKFMLDYNQSATWSFCTRREIPQPRHLGTMDDEIKRAVHVKVPGACVTLSKIFWQEKENKHHYKQCNSTYHAYMHLP